MNEVDLLGLTPAQADGWREFFRRGEVFVAGVDRARLARHRRWNSGVRIAAIVGILGCVGLIVALALTDIGRPVTYVLIAVLMVAFAAVVVRVRLAWRRLRASSASADDYLVVSAQGVRVAGLIDLPWNEVTIGLGFDGRGAPISGIRRPGAFLSRSSGVGEAEIWLGHENVRQMRDRLPKQFAALFEVIADHGAVRIPIDTVVDSAQVRACIAAIYVAATDGGSSMTLSNDRSTIVRTTMNMMKTDDVLAQSRSPKKGESHD